MKMTPIVNKSISSVVENVILLSLLFVLGSSIPLDSGLGYVYSTSGTNETVQYVVVDRVYTRQITVVNGLLTEQMDDSDDDLTMNVVLRQTTDGMYLVQAVLDTDGKYKDCDVTEDWEQIHDFLLSFPNIDDFMKRAEPRNSDVGFEDIVIYSNTESEGEITTLRWISNNKAPDSIKKLVDMNHVRAECRVLHRNMDLDQWDQEENAVEMNAGNDLPSSEESNEGNTRNRRSLMMYPGTLWCGVDNNAQSKDELGQHSRTDSCCREHDHCDVRIISFSTDYYLLNYRFHTISHCGCDTRFRRCLQKIKSPAAKTIGRIYFDILQMKCFNLEKRLQCTSRSWWGSCSKYEMVDTAFAESPRPWNQPEPIVDTTTTTTPTPPDPKSTKPVEDEEESSGDDDNEDIMNETWNSIVLNTETRVTE